MIVSPNNISLHISNYKTKKVYGIKTIKITDRNVIGYMRDWLKVSPNPEYILVLEELDKLLETPFLVFLFLLVLLFLLLFVFLFLLVFVLLFCTG